MKIKSLNLPAYHPLKNVQHQFKSGFNLIFGSNEQGKSLRIDAMTKLLVGKKSKKFSNIQRVEDDPSKLGGFLEIKTQDQQTHKLQAEDNFAELLGITADDCENIFLIRNSQLSIGTSLTEEKDFYTNFTDRLTGLKTKLIQDLEKELRSLAHITPNSDKFRSTNDNNQLGDRIDQAQTLISPEGQLYRILHHERLNEWDGQVHLLVQKKSTFNQNKDTISQLEIARKREEYEKSNKSLETIKTKQQELKKLDKFSKEQLQQWHELKTGIKHSQKNLTDNQLTLKELKNEEKEIKQKIQEKSTELNLAEHRYNLIQNQFTPEMENLKAQKAELKAQQTQKSFWTWATVGAGIILLISLVGIWQNAQTLLNIVAALSLLLTSTGLFFLTKTQQLEAKFAQQLTKIKLNLEAQQISADNLDSILAALQKQINEFVRLREEHKQLEMELQSKQETIDRHQKKLIEHFQNEIQKSEREINRIKLESSLQTYQDYEAKLKQKETLESQIQEHRAILKNKYGSAMIASREIERWQKEIDRLAQYADQATKYEYNEKKLQKLKSQQKSLEEDINDLQNKLNQFAHQLARIADQAQKIFLNSETINLESKADLEHLTKKLEDFVNQHRRKKENALTIIDILSEIEAEDREKIASLFGADSVITQHFQQITNHSYQLVEFDQEETRIIVTNKEGEKLYPQKLSAGTYDQLYFAIRLGLAQQLLAEPGFFIMDDPFLKSDQKRLFEQLQMLLELSKQGWQILYFSAKNEVKQTLKELGKFHLIEV